MGKASRRKSGSRRDAGASSAGAAVASPRDGKPASLQPEAMEPPRGRATPRQKLLLALAAAAFLAWIIFLVVMALRGR